MKKLLLSLLIALGVSASSAVAEDVSAYLVGKHVDAATAAETLKGAGYEVVATYPSVENGHTIVFTNAALKAEGAKPNRAHAAVLRLFVDDQEKKISITNPVYFGKAFMQDDYNENVHKGELDKINSLFPGLVGSQDILSFGDLGGYRFMFGMPYYEDSDTLAKGSNDELLGKLKNPVFTLKLSDKSTLVGYELSADTKGFVKTIGRANAAVLPYCIAIEDGKATALAPKYYLAVSYPKLTMGEFMTISNVPGVITAELEAAFK